MADRHSHPFRFFDRVLESGRDACAVIKLVSAGEATQDGREAPERPYAAALVLEAMAQAALPLAGAEDTAAPGEDPPDGGAVEGGAAAPSGGPPGMIVGLDEVRFHLPIRPGDRLLVRAQVVGRLGTMIRVRSEAWVDDELAAEGELTIATGRGR